MPTQQHLVLPPLNTDEGRKLESMLIGMGSSLEGKYSSYKSARADKELEWDKAIHQYEGHWDSQDLEKIERALSMTDGANDPITVNITRPKTNVARARMKDIQFPTGGDFNFYLRPAPLTKEVKKALETDQPTPEMSMMAAEAGVPATDMPSPKAMAEEIVETNISSAPKMERKIRNRFIYANYGRKARLGIDDLCIKGTVVMKGPIIQHKKNRSYTTEATTAGSSVQVLEENFVPVPTVERVDPLLFFPDPSARHPDEIEDAFELHPMSASELIELAKTPGFIKPQIAKVLEEEPSISNIPDIVVRTSRERSSSNVNNRYWVKEYRGPLDKQVLYDAGLISEDEFINNMKQFIGEAWFTHKVVIKLSLSLIEGEDTLPYSVSTWENDPNSVFGHGVPYLLRNSQRVVNNAYLMLLDNASLTAGPQIVLNKEMIIPASQDNDYSIEPMKVWFLTEYGSDVREAMQFVNVPAQMEGIAQIMDTSMQFADVESSTPLLQQGEVPSGNNTTTGLAMVMSATNIIQKAASMNWDDHITKPMVNRFYHYEMQYGDDEDLKGDFEIEVGGATERIEADIRSQEIERMLGLAGSNQDFLRVVNSNKAFRALVDNTRTGDVLRSEEEVEEIKAQEEQAAQQQQEQDPEAMKAQAALIMAQAKAKEIEGRQQLEAKELELKAMEMEAKYEASRMESEARQNEATLEYQTELMKMAQDRNTTVARLEQELQIADMDNRTKLNVKEMDFAKFQMEVDLKNVHGEGI